MEKSNAQKSTEEALTGVLIGTGQSFFGSFYFVIELDNGPTIKARVEGLPELRKHAHVAVQPTSWCGLRRFVFLRYLNDPEPLP